MVARAFIFASIINVLSALDCITDETAGCTGTFISVNPTNCRGYQACKDKNIFVSGGTVSAYGDQSAYGANIQATNVNAFGYQSMYTTDIQITGTLTIDGYQGAYGSNIKAAVVTSYGRNSLYTATIEPYSTTLTVNLYGSQSGYNADVICQSGSTCTVNCVTQTACQSLQIYCYSGATCKYDCDGDGNDNFGCPSVVTGVDTGLTDPQIHEIYLRNLAKKPKIKPLPELPGPESPAQQPFILSFTSSQFGLLCVLNALFVFASVGLCLWNISTAKNQGQFIKKVDFE